MTYNEKHDITLMRYSSIAPAVNETLPAGQSLTRADRRFSA